MIAYQLVADIAVHCCVETGICLVKLSRDATKRVDDHLSSRTRGQVPPRRTGKSNEYFFFITKRLSPDRQFKSNNSSRTDKTKELSDCQRCILLTLCSFQNMDFIMSNHINSPFCTLQNHIKTETSESLPCKAARPYSLSHPGPILLPEHP
jgi:hypothetical protein